VISTRFKQQLLYGSLIAAAVTIPLFNNLNSIALILFVCIAAFQRPLKESLHRLARDKTWLIPFIYFFWIITTYFWDTSGGFTTKQLERYLGLAFVPLGIALAPLIPRNKLKSTCFAFAIVTVALCIISLIRSYIEYQQTQDYRVFYYHYLSGQVKLNAIFLSIYCLASIFWILYFGFITQRKLPVLLRSLLLLAVIFLTLMIFLLTSKMIMLLGLLAMVFSLIYFGYRKGYLLWSLLIVVVFIGAGFFLIKNLSYLKYRLAVTEWKEYKGEEDRQNGIAIRIFMWKTGLKLIEKRPVLGYGLRGAREATLEQYKEKGFSLGYELKYHTHNQYIETTLMSGIPGLALFLAMIGCLLWGAIKKANFLLLLGILHFASHALIESLFEVQQEMIFFIFFLFLFYYHPPAPSGKSLTKPNADNALL
jgi:O-antigen ligase